MSSAYRLAVMGLCLAANFPSSCLAQDARGSINGRVTDAQDAVIVGVRISAVNQQTGVASSAVSNDAGVFRLPFLVPGVYRLTAEMTGFRTYVQADLQVRTNDSLDLSVRMDVGSVTETIEVKGGTPLLETSTSTVGQVMDTRRLEDLPQRGGNPLELQRLIPGVANLTSLRTMKSSSPDGTSQTTVNGTGSYSTQYNIDGVSNSTNDRGRGYARVAFIPPSSAVSEFKMQSNPYDATVGHAFGPVVNVTSKGGTNDLHGTMYYWAKNSAFDAMGFFDNRAGLPKITYQDHRFGLTVSGPVILPRLYKGRNRTFVLYAWEENRFGQPSTSNQTSTVPTAAERAGDFSALLKLGSTYQIYNPFTTRTASTAGRYQRDPVPGNILPPSQLAAVGLNLAALYPLPNQTGLADGRNNYYYPDVRIQRYDSNMGRIDHAFSENHRMFVRMNHYAYEIPKDLLGIPATKYYSNQINRGAAIDDVIVLNPSTILNLRYGLVSADFPEKRATQGIGLGKFGFSQQLLSMLDASKAAVPRVAASGFATLSDWADGDGLNTSVTHNFVAELSKLKGAHSLRFGSDLRLFRTFANRYPQAIAPDFTFASTYTRGPLDNSATGPLGQEFAALLFGIPDGNMTTTSSSALQNTYSGFYLQDDYRVNPKLTINLGLRYEMEWPLNERYNRLVAGYDYASASPVETQAKVNYARNPIPEISPAQFAARGGLTFVNAGNRSPYSRNNGHFLPRLGLAYQLTPKTVLRSGYGIYFDTLGVDRFLPVQSGFAQQTPIQASLDNGVTYIATAANPFPSGLLPPLGAAGGLATNLGQAITYFDPAIRQPYSQRWSFGIQRFLPFEFLLDASYVGNRSTHLGATQNVNATPGQYLSTSPTRDQTAINYLTQTFPNPFYGLNKVYGATMSRANLLRPYPQFGDISVARDDGFAWYHSLQARIEKRFSKGYTLAVGYTYSKYMQATEYLNPTDTRPYRSVSDLDRPLIFTVSGVYELPFGRGRHFGASMSKPMDALFGGWQVNGSVIRQAGAPLGFGNALFYGNIKDIPLPKDQRSADRWFNTSAGFEKTTSKQLANNLRTFPLRFSGVRSDGQSTWNFSLAKSFPIYERMKGQFRAETYNAMNHPSFANPNLTPTNSSFGVIGQTNSEPRNWQFALRLTF